MDKSLDERLVSLAVYLTVYDPTWVSFLESEGIPWQLLDLHHIQSGSVEVLVIPHKTPPIMRRIGADLACRGITTITEVPLPDITVVNCEIWSFPYHADDFSGLEKTHEPGAISVQCISLPHGQYYHLLFRLADAWGDKSVARKCIMVNVQDNIVVRERLARVVKKNLRRLVLDVLRRAFFERGLPLVHKWYWPGQSRSVFCFRGDMDGGPVENLRCYLDTVRPFAGSITLFVCTSLYQKNPEIIKSLVDAGIEIQSHTHCHYVFSEGWTNNRNLEKAEHFLASLGVKTSGLVAPAYFWHPSLHTLLEKRGYRYASCFGLGYDHLPYYPVVNRRINSVLEIPFHCVGDFLPKFNIELDGPVTRSFFAELIAKKYAAGEPMNLYGHPDMSGRLGSTPALVRFIYEQAMSFSDVWTGQMGQLASWWQSRSQFAFEPFFDTKRQSLICRFPARHDLHTDRPAASIHMPDGSWGLVDFADCGSSGIPINKIRIGTPLRLPQPTEVGEVIYAPDTPSLRRKLWYHKNNMSRRIRKYREIYFGG